MTFTIATRKRQRTESVRRVRVAPLTRRCRASTEGCANDPARRRIPVTKTPDHEGPRNRMELVIEGNMRRNGRRRYTARLSPRLSG